VRKTLKEIQPGFVPCERPAGDAGTDHASAPFIPDDPKIGDLD
jgi:hypothetical protein